MVQNGTRAARSGALIAGLTLGALLLIASAIGAVPRIVGIFTDLWNGRSALVTGREPFIPLDEPGASAASELDRVDYSEVAIVSGQALTGPRMLQAGAALLGILVILTGAALVVMLAVRMLRGRPFARMLSWGLGAVGLLTALAAALGPQLEALAVDIAVREIGYRVYGPDHDGVLTPDGPEALVLPLWDPLWVIDRIDTTLLLLGVLLALLGLLVADGRRLQRDTEGLV